MRKYLQALREERQVSQTKLAHAAGVKPNYYCMIENGERQQDMNLTIIEKLATAFGVPMQTIIDAESAYRAQRPDTA